MPAQLVLCRQDKSPLQGGWNKRWPTADEAEAHVVSGGRLGIVPGSIDCMVIDIDKFDDDTIEPIFDAIKEPLMYESPKGYHIWVRIPRDRATITNKAWKLDNGSGDIRGDNGYVVLWCEQHELKEWRLGKAVINDPDEVLALVGLGIEGNRNNRLNQKVYKAAVQGNQEAIDEAIEEATLDGLEQDEIEATTASAVKGAGKVGRALERNDIGLGIMLRELNVGLRYNTRAMTNQIKYQDLPWYNVSDRVLDHIRSKIAKNYTYATSNGFKPMRFTPDLWRTAYNALLYENERDPFVDWLLALPGWDGIERIETLLTHMFGADDTELNRWASGYIFRGAVQRAFKLGAKLDTMPVLIGEQGIGKSSFLSQILPFENPEWFSDALNLSCLLYTSPSPRDS